MSGHSKWATIKRAKGKVDAARGKLFGRLIKEITVAVKQGGGPDIDSNPRLRTAVSNARGNNMPNKNIENAISKAAGSGSADAYEEITFEAYAPGGAAVVIETMTDNRNRTVAEVRHAITKNGGNLGAANSVKWMFHDKGIIHIDGENTTEEQLMEIALEAGADDILQEEGSFEVSTTPEAFEDVRAAIEEAGIEMLSAEVTKVAENTVAVEAEHAPRLLKMVNMLDDLDDTQKVYGNYDLSSIPEDILEEYL